MVHQFFVFATSMLLRGCAAAPRILYTQTARGDLILRNLYITNPFEADPTSSYNSSLHSKYSNQQRTFGLTITVVVVDEDHPKEKAIQCELEWQAGVAPPPETRYQCENNTLRAWFPEGTFHGVQNFRLEFAHTVIDTKYANPFIKIPVVNHLSIGPCPDYCYATKFAAVNLTYPTTSRYDCDTKNATCEQQLNTTISAPVYLVIA